MCARIETDANTSPLNTVNTHEAATQADPRWAALLERDKRFDGEFVYAVTTTGVYCRPSCPSRLAKPANIRFFDTTHLARDAGYRPCKRCRPEEVALDLRRQDLVEAACRSLESSTGGLALKELAGQAGLSTYHFHRIFKQATGLTPKPTFRRCRHSGFRHL